MQLHPLTEAFVYPDTAMLVALSIRNSNGALWIIENPHDAATCLVCQEAEFGVLAMPDCDNVLSVSESADGFTAPVWRVKLGPGIWTWMDKI